RGLERLLVQVSQEWLDSRSSETKRVVGEEAIAGLEERERSLLEDIGLWQSKFSAAVQTVGLGEDADPAMALAALEAWRTVPDLLAERQNRQRRVCGMTRDMETFEGSAGNLATTVAPDLAGIPADVAVGLLHERLLAATAENKHRAALSAELERTVSALARLKVEQEGLAVETAEIAGRLSRQPEELSRVLEDLHQRQRLDKALKQCRERFAEQAEGAPEEEIRTALASFDKVAAGIEIDR